MVLGIDASNIKSGGGFVHLCQVICYANPYKYGINKVIIYGGNQLDQIADKDWLIKRKPRLLKAGGFVNESIWKLFFFKNTAKKKCQLIFSPGGTFYSKKIPYVTMSQNMLVYKKSERNRYKLYFLVWIRLYILNYLQAKSIRNAAGVIFISKYARDYILGRSLKIDKRHDIIHHGASECFFSNPKVQREIAHYSMNKPFNLLYVSIIDFYKHQWNVVEAVAKIRDKGIPIQLNLVGPAFPNALKKLKKSIKIFDSKEIFIKYHGSVPYSELARYYLNADGFVFASSCENMPNIVIEAMSAGLPIASSNYSPMPEFLKDAAIYFDPCNAESIEEAIFAMVVDKVRRHEMSEKAFEYAKEYSWEACSSETFSFLSQMMS